MDTLQKHERSKAMGLVSRQSGNYMEIWWLVHLHMGEALAYRLVSHGIQTLGHREIELFAMLFPVAKSHVQVVLYA